MTTRLHWENNDPATPALVDPMLDDIQVFPDVRVREAAKRYALERIKWDREVFADVTEMGELQTDTIRFIGGYEQALKDLGQ